jgi:rubrerythrin
LAGTQGIVVVVHTAIDREKEAAALYLALARTVADAKAKNVLIHLASDELGHLDRLERHLVSVLAGKEGVLPRSGLADAIAARLSESSSLAMPDPSELTRADEVRILEIALDRELEANLQYVGMAESAGPGEARELFLSLAKEEETHARILRAEIDAIGRSGFWFDMQEFTMEK